MLFANTWNNIIEWFRDRSERNQLVQSFNQSARNAFVMGLAPTMLKASISKGNPAYRHEFSAWLNTGFRIQALAGRALSKEEIMVIGMAILADTTLVRRLIALGWDTLEIHSDAGVYGCRWNLTEYANIGGMLYEHR